MGQYYKVVNLDKRQYLHPHKFGDGLKLMEFGCDSCGTLTALAVLLADGNNRGGGDLRSDNPLIGSWAGDRIVITGDYADYHKFVEEGDLATFPTDEQPKINLYCVADQAFEDISAKVLAVICEDDYVMGRIQKVLANTWPDSSVTRAATEAGIPIPEKTDKKPAQSKSLRPDMVLTAKPPDDDGKESE